MDSVKQNLCCSMWTLVKDDNMSKFTVSELPFPPLVLYTFRLLLGDAGQVFVEEVQAFQSHTVQTHVMNWPNISNA